MRNSVDQSSVAELYTRRAASYHRFVRFFGYPGGLRAILAGDDVLHSDTKVLDAGCGSGLLTRACLAVACERGLSGIHFHGFDLTPHMLERFRAWIARKGVTGVELAEADALQPEQLPSGWTDHDLVVTASMLEYLPGDRIAEALGHLRARLKPGGRLLLFISRRNLLTRLLIRRWWNANVHDRREVSAMLESAGFTRIHFGSFPGRYFHLNLWGLVVHATGNGRSPAQSSIRQAKSPGPATEDAPGPAPGAFRTRPRSARAPGVRHRAWSLARTALLAWLCLTGIPARPADAPEPPLHVSFRSVTALPADPPDQVESYGPSPLQRRELWFPEGTGPHPAVFLLHGGCWLAAYGVDHVRPLATALRAAGWLVVAPEYRRVGDAGGGWPGTFEDVEVAFDGLLEGAAAGRIDPERIALAGHSAGGHLALWLAARVDREGAADRAARPQPALILGLAAITDPERYARGAGSCQAVTPRLLGGSPEEVPERYAAASPVHLPAPTVTPILLRGSEDEIVPATQAQAYRDAVGARIVPLTGAGHFDPIHPGTAAFDALLQALSPLAPTSESTP